jgi:hypothetical protein
VAEEKRSEIDQAFEDIEREAPPRVARTIKWLRDPEARWIRIPIGVLFILAGFLWFLPIVGIEFLPIGLLLIAQDVPFLRKPVGRLIIWLVHRWIALKHWWQGRHDPGQLER